MVWKIKSYAAVDSEIVGGLIVFWSNGLMFSKHEIGLRNTIVGMLLDGKPQEFQLNFRRIFAKNRETFSFKQKPFASNHNLKNKF